MPPNPERRTAILDTAIDIVVDVGIGGLTHRQIDERAGLPAGTTSNYFRTRLALLEATATHVVDLHWRHVEALQSALPSPMNRASVAALMTRMVADPDEAARRRHLARFELFIEATRRPELRPFLHELQHAAMKTAGLILASAGIEASAEQVDQLTRLLNGLTFSNLTIDQPDGNDPAGLIDRILDAVLTS
ncbi:TetR family transcriptional regulator [Mycobacterium sp. CVI_P3]|uniref:TetR family transcriptional regulator n=1 Tax=Mycobacterium pinniadriaticum TaxID=2994102 RepID=A0ABT3SK27_9MYCO|nr:TetR/AcrR family transcriptional regulator [Mycobacterium pinniadriaticum]MCX2933177.1 TetR family transcriptional regulator [Mycobacterium pinniadriaticum]MCX2939523.1 TetR family transcriptional regulator [Mycobacterium pinniadriaticum]